MRWIMSELNVKGQSAKFNSKPVKYCFYSH